MKNNKSKRVLIGFSEVAGQFSRVCSEMEMRGIDVSALFLCDYKFMYDTKIGEQIKLFDLYSGVCRKYTKDNNSFLKKIIWGAFTIQIGIIVFVYSCIHFDYFLFVMGNSFFSSMPILNRIKKIRYLDLKVLKKLKKRVIMWFVGSDSRPAYVNGAYDDDISFLKKKNDDIFYCVKNAEKYCFDILDGPASAYYHKKKYIIGQRLGLPINLNCVGEAGSRGNRIRVVHAPSNKKAKGTEIINRIVESVCNKGYDIEYVTLHNVSHDEVLKELAIADIVIDQVYSDTPLAGLGNEAAINKVPVLVSGYYSKEAKEVLGEACPPSVFCEPDELEEKLIELIENEQLRREIGLSAYEYVQANWNVSRVVDNLLSAFEGKLGDEFYFDPYKSNYAFGLGISKEEIKKRVDMFIEYYGEESLHLEDKHHLLENLMNI